MGDLEKQVVVLEEGREEEKEEKGEENERLLEGMAVLDFDMLCSSVALQTAHGTWGKLGGTTTTTSTYGDEEQYGGGVLRMWEGELLDCFDHRRIALESACCPCYRFGKNMKRAGLGSCYIQVVVYFLLAVGVFFNFIAFIVTRRRYFLYLAVAFTVTVGVYLGLYRTRMRKKFNIKGSDSSLDDCVYHFVCPCCTLCQMPGVKNTGDEQCSRWNLAWPR